MPSLWPIRLKPQRTTPSPLAGELPARNPSIIGMASSSSSSKPASLCPVSSSSKSLDPDTPYAVADPPIRDFTSDLPDECLALVFLSLANKDREACSLVCRRWLIVEGRHRHRLSLDARTALIEAVPTLLGRFDSITKLALRCDRRSTSISNEALALIAQRCPLLSRLKLRACREVTDQGLSAVAASCKNLRKLSCGSANFGVVGISAVFTGCPLLEELSLKRLRGVAVPEDDPVNGISPLKPSSSVRVISLKEIHNGHCYASLIAASPGLRVLRITQCSGDWNSLFEGIAPKVRALTELHVERIQLGDRAMFAIGASCTSLEVLHLVKTPECSDFGVAVVAGSCRGLRKIQIDGWMTNRIGDEGISAIARYSCKLVELILIGVNPSVASISQIAENCKVLERLAFCWSDTVGDEEMACVASKCVALRKLCVKCCPVTDKGLEALAGGCPNLVKLKMKRCRGVTARGAEWLRQHRGSLAVNLDDIGIPGTVEQQDGSASDEVTHENDGAEPLAAMAELIISTDAPSTSSGPSTFSRARQGISSGRNMLVATLRRWSQSSSNHSHLN